MEGDRVIADRVANVLAQRGRAPRHWIALSGGLDSTVLAHVCRTLNRADASLDFAVAHIHHGLQRDADSWAIRAEEFCRTLPLPLTVRHVDARPLRGESPEEAARRARYAALRDLMHPGDVLMTAQHRDDQAETLLLQLLRGAGPAGLASMPVWAPFGRGWLCRPLLDVPRPALRAYADRHGLSWIDDPGNDDRRFRRNLLRHELLPHLRKHWPDVDKALSRSARHCAEADLLLTEWGQELLCAIRHPVRHTLRIEPLAALSVPRQRLVLRTWLRTAGRRMPPASVIERILGEVLPARDDRQPAVSWPEGVIRRHRGELYLMTPSPPFPSGLTTAWDGATLLELAPANGTLRASLEPGSGIDPRHWNQREIVIGYRQGGESLGLAGRTGTRELKKLLQQAGLPPWVRERIPLIYLGGELAAVADLWVCRDFEGPATGRNVRIHWDRPAGLLATASPPTLTDRTN